MQVIGFFYFANRTEVFNARRQLVAKLVAPTPFLTQADVVPSVKVKVPDVTCLLNSFILFFFLSVCEVDGVTYEPGDQWAADSCTTCSCDGGKIVCQERTCPTPTCSNPTQVRLPVKTVLFPANFDLLLRTTDR